MTDFVPTQQIDSSNTLSENDSSTDDSSWGKLYAINTSFTSVDLVKNETTFGRNPTSDVDLSKVSTNLCASTAYSGLHFKIKREFSVKTGLHALLEDLSSNGTFINGEKVGKGRIQALKNNCEISLSRKDNKAYIFVDSSNEDKNLPIELRKKYTISKQLGSGAYGEVKLAFENKTGNKFAVKIISKKRLTGYGKAQMNLQLQINSEIEILKKLEHPCIIKIIEVFDSPEAVYIVLDLIEGGELFDKVVKIEHYDEKTAKLLFYQMVLAIKYLHEKGISHRDIKPENILLCSGEENETLIKITDFGLSKFFDTSTMKTFCGTPNYLAPEVLLNKGEGIYTNKIDNWSLGVILYICLAGYPPFSDESAKVNLENQIKRGIYDFPKEYWSHVSDSAISVIKRLLCTDPVKRASLEEILEHEWIKNDTEMQRKAYELMHPNEKMNISCSSSANSSPILNSKRTVKDRRANDLDNDDDNVNKDDGPKKAGNNNKKFKQSSDSTDKSV